MLELVKDYPDLAPLVDEIVENRFETYSDFLVHYNEKVNLTAITDPEEIKVKHFLDSIMLLTVLNIKKGATIIDIGTGAGFPGIPLKILRPDLRLTLLDSLNKRIIFLNLLCEKLDIESKMIHGRAEEVAMETPFRDGYDVVVSRAVSNLGALAEYCLPFAEVGGVFAAYKGPDYEEELDRSKHAIKLLGGKIKSVETIKLPGEQTRNIILIEKIEETPDKYPRQRINIAKNPLI